jgi:uncharacterized cupin superfamily protein
MVPEARLVRREGGLVPDGEGWFVVNARDARWWHHDAFGSATTFENEEDNRFKEFGINIQILEPGQPNSMYHAENAQEDFLVLYGECLLLAEGEERRLGQWDFVHCPPWTKHVFVGAGDGPCAILMVGTRPEHEELIYPVDEVVRRHNAGVEEETTSGREAYARFPKSREEPLREGALPSFSP